MPLSVNRRSRLLLVLVLNLLLVVGLIIVGVVSHSLGVLAAGVDYLGDAAAIGVSLFAIWLAGRPHTERHPEGYPKAPAIAAVVNAGWLLVLCAAVTIEAVRRLANGAPHVEAVPVVVASGIAAAVMTAGALVLAADSEEGGAGERMNMRAVLLDTVGDAAAAAGVVVAGAVILATGGNSWLDPLVALIIAVVVGYHAARLSWQAASEFRTRST